jgi:hypothetical protein
MVTRERVHQLIEELPDSELPVIERFLEERRADPVLRTLAEAPEDDEPLTPEDAAAIAEGVEALKRGETISQDELRRSLGL